MNKRALAAVVCVIAVLSLTGCTWVQRGAAIGAGAGAVPGAIIGHNGATGVWEGALIGAGAGGVVGALIGDGMSQGKESDEIANLKRQVAALTAENSALTARTRELKPDASGEIAGLKSQIAALTEENNKLRKAAQAGKPREFVIQGDVLFASGSSKLTPEGMKALADVAAKIRKDYPGKNINIEGHTDDVPVSGSTWKSNWELGAARAVSVLHYMVEKQGFTAATMSATTFAEFKPVKPNDSPENRKENRRAVIVVSVQ